MKSFNYQFIIIVLSGLCFSTFQAQTEFDPISKMSRNDIEQFLKSAEVVNIEDTKIGITKPKRITLQTEDKQIRAVFKYISTPSINKRSRGVSKTKMLNQSDRFQYGIAAYKLDQLLGMNMIPVTVPRILKWQKGMVQLWVENSVVKINLKKSKYKELEVCDFQKQNKMMKVFDILIHNDDRNLGNILYTLDDCRLWMIDHSRAFRVTRKIPKKLQSHEINLSEEFAQKLKDLNYKKLKQHLGEYIKTAQITSMLKRRDIILDKWVKAGKPDFPRANINIASANTFTPSALK